MLTVACAKPSQWRDPPDDPVARPLRDGKGYPPMHSLPLRRLISLLAASALVATFVVAAVPAAALAAAPPASYFNGFENSGDAVSPSNSTDTQAMFDVTRVPSGTNTITSASGSSHATASALWSRVPAQGQARP